MIIDLVPDVVEAEGREPVPIHGGSGPPPPVRLFAGTPEGRRDVPTVGPGHRHRGTLQGWLKIDSAVHEAESVNCRVKQNIKTPVPSNEGVKPTLERCVHGKAYREGDRSFLWCLYVLHPFEDNLSSVESRS